MSIIRADSIKNRAGNGAPDFPNGITVTGVVTSTTLNASITGNLSVTGNLGVGGTITYEDVTNVDSVGVITARSGIKIGPTAGVAATIFSDGSINTSGIVTAINVSAASSVTATTFYGSGVNLTGISSPNLGASETQGYQNLKILNTANNSTVITCDSILLENSSGTLIKVSTVNVTLNATTTGANGLDTGSLAQGKFYYIYIINNGSTTASLASLSSTSPTLPSGYTYKARVGGVSTNANAGGANIIPSVQVNTNHMFAETQTNDKVRVTNGSGGQSAAQSALPMVSALASTWHGLTTQSGATTAGTFHVIKLQGSSNAYEQSLGIWHSGTNAIGDMVKRYPLVPIITVTAGVPQTWVYTTTNTGPNWNVYCVGFQY